MSIVNDVVVTFDSETSILSITVTKTDVDLKEGNFSAPSEPYDVVTEIDLSA